MIILSLTDYKNDGFDMENRLKMKRRSQGQGRSVMV
jgi:hypothetical protein